MEMMSSEERNINLVVKSGVVATEAALMFDVVYVLAYALQKLEEAVHPVSKREFEVTRGNFPNEIFS